MNPITDDDLVLYHYRDGLEPSRLTEIEDALFASSDLADRYAALKRTLARADAMPESVADADLAARVWTRLEPRLSATTPRARPAKPSIWQMLHEWLNPPRLAFAGAFAVALAVGIGFYAGRQSVQAPDSVPQIARDDTATSARVLDAYVAAHLRATEGVLLTASNSSSTEMLDGNRELAASLIEANRLYALAAERAGNARLADFLRQLEPVLISLANQPASAPVQSSEGLRDYLRSTDLLFQVRATQARLDGRGDRRT